MRVRIHSIAESQVPLSSWGEEILRLAEERPVQYAQKTIVTVARLSEEKGLLRCVPIFAKLRAEGVQVRWHIVGGGPLENELKSAIREAELEDCIILEGQQTNPYRFLKNADYLFLPSFHEAAPVVFDEAIVLEVPILTTDTLSARELVIQNGAGMVCGGEAEEIYQMLRKALTSEITIQNTVTARRKLSMEQFDLVCNI